MEDGRGKRIKKGEERGENRAKEEGRWKMEAIKRREMIEERREKKKKGCSTVPRFAGL
jgi:hypothetical protein